MGLCTSTLPLRQSADPPSTRAALQAISGFSLGHKTPRGCRVVPSQAWQAKCQAGSQPTPAISPTHGPSPGAPTPPALHRHRGGQVGRLGRAGACWTGVSMAAMPACWRLLQGGCRGGGPWGPCGRIGALPRPLPTYSGSGNAVVAADQRSDASWRVQSLPGRAAMPQPAWLPAEHTMWNHGLTTRAPPPSTMAVVGHGHLGAVTWRGWGQDECEARRRGALNAGLVPYRAPSGQFFRNTCQHTCCKLSVHEGVVVAAGRASRAAAAVGIARQPRGTTILLPLVWG